MGESNMSENRDRNIHIKNLFLDPNNYRFIDNKNYKQVEENEITDERIQKRTRNFITGEKNENIKDLLLSFKKNGYLPVDQIQVHQISNNIYKVIEGNRRLTALKVLYEEYSEGLDIGNLDPGIFRKIPVVLYENVDDSEQRVLMALKHISGNKKWASLNQAQLLYDLIYKHGKSEEDVVESIGGITKKRLRRSLRAIALISEYKRSDYGDQFETDMYSIFEEIVQYPTIREWIGWDESSFIPTNEINTDRLFSWISEDEIISQNELDDESHDEVDEYSKDILIRREKIIAKSSDIRDLAKIITDPQAVNKMEECGSITQAYSLSDRISKDKFVNAVDTIEKQLDTALLFINYADTESANRLEAISKKTLALKEGLNPKEYDNIKIRSEIERSLLVTYKNKLFSEINIKKYKGLDNLNIKNLNKINIFAGINNAGKTSLLEAVALLTKLNDIYYLMELLKNRAKLYNESLNPRWLIHYLPEDIDIYGKFDDNDVKINITKFQETSEEFDKTSYLNTLRIDAQFREDIFKSNIRLFENKDSSVYFERIRNLCNSNFTSPFFIQQSDYLIQNHQKAIQSKSYEKILNFLKTELDNNIDNIELVGDFKRFFVTHKVFDEALDLTQFGEGMQRIFTIVLQFAASQNGIVLIDEFENAIHYSLLVQFVKFIELLSNEFNVQVFITSHSKECIDAFLDNTNEKNISAYRLERVSNKVKCDYISGEKLKKLSNTINADLRGN